MTEPSVEQDFVAAQSGDGARLLGPERARRLVRHVRASEHFVRSIEAFEVKSDDTHVLRVDWSMLGLSYDEQDAASPEALNDIADALLLDTGRTGLNMLFSVWVAPRSELDDRSS